MTNSETPKEKKTKLNKWIAAILILQAIVIVILLYIINPLKIVQQQALNMIEQQVEAIVDDIPKGETPAMFQITNAESLRSESPENAQVYKEARDNDYVLAYSTKMIIYRREGQAIVYTGPAPAVISKTKQLELINEIVSKALAGKIVDLFTAKNPELLVVSDPQKLKDANKGSSFYAKVEKDDVLAYFAGAGKVVLYRPSVSVIIDTTTANR